jgi:hypothetical protein
VYFSSLLYHLFKFSATKIPTPDCRRTPHDIFFVVDGSASIKSRNFVHVRKFLMDLLGLLRAGISDINIGMQQFSEVRKTKIMMDLDKYSLDEQMQVVDTMVYQRGRRTMTGNALTMVADQVGIINLCFILYNRKEN